jgi:hypothetical protein
MRKVTTPVGGHNRFQRRQSIHFARVAGASLRRAESLVPASPPDGRRHGREWVVLNPKRADRHVGSFSVNLHTGKWADFASGDRGRDLISLRAYLDGTGQLAAARKLQEGLGP